MKNSTPYLIGIILAILLGSYLNYNFCCDSNEEIVLPKENVVMDNYTTNPFILNEQSGELIIKDNDNFNFNTSNTDVLKPLSSNLEQSISKSIKYFSSHPELVLSITGYYSDDEINNSAYENLGLARANAIKNIFVSKGLPSKNINTLGELNNKLRPNIESILFGPNNFKVQNVSNTEDLEAEMKLIADEIKDKPLIFNFELAAATLKLTPEQRIKVQKIARYLDKVENSTCSIVGHTDNTGKPESNLILGQERADYAKNYLVKNHIRESKITSISKGQIEPLTSNETPEGRSKNRRIVVTIN
jgi:outer membrane protein OmpA-like peptidoglycan-associated protein